MNHKKDGPCNQGLFWLSPFLIGFSGPLNKALELKSVPLALGIKTFRTK